MPTRRFTSILFCAVPIWALCVSPAFGQAETINERALRLELDTKYVPPPGDPNSHFTMGFARTLCSGVFVSGLDPDFAAENIGYFTSPYKTRSVVVNREVDFDEKRVHLTMENGVVRSAKHIGDLGCVPLPIGSYPHCPILRQRRGQWVTSFPMIPSLLKLTRRNF